MFSKLYNEAIIKFTMETKSPLFIKAAEDSSLDPTAADNTYLSFYKNGEPVPVIPGTSIKGVFRSSAEELMRSQGLEPCNVLNNSESCGGILRREQERINRKFNVIEKYDRSCCICKLFGSSIMKSRISFYDAFPVGEYRIGKRKSVAIDRITGSSKSGALFDFEYVEYGKFKTEIKLKNFFVWQLKLLFNLIERVNDGLITFGGLTSKGFGKIKIDDINLELRYYNKHEVSQGYIEKDYYILKRLDGIENIDKALSDINIDKNTVKRCDLENEQII